MSTQSHDHQISTTIETIPVVLDGGDLGSEGIIFNAGATITSRPIAYVTGQAEMVGVTSKSTTFGKLTYGQNFNGQFVQQGLIVESGSCIIQSRKMANVYISETTLRLSADSLILLDRADSSLKIRNLSSKPTIVHLAQKDWRLSAGQEMIIGNSKSQGEFEDGIARRAISFSHTGDWWCSFSDVSIASLMCRDPLLKEICKVKSAGNADLQKIVSKTAAALLLMTAYRGPYSVANARKLR